MVVDVVQPRQVPVEVVLVDPVLVALEVVPLVRELPLAVVVVLLVAVLALPTLIPVELSDVELDPEGVLLLGEESLKVFNVEVCVP